MDIDMTNYFDNTSFIALIQKYSKHFLIIMVVALIAAIIFSGEMFIRPKYKSTAILYPSNLIPYAEESATEQMLQLLESNDIRQSIIKKYNFSHKYGVDINKRGGKAKLYEIYDNHILIKKTEYESVKIEVLDYHPDTAAAITNEIIQLLSLKSKTLQKEKSAELLKVYNDRMALKLNQIDSMETMIKELRVKYGILDYERQVEEASKQYLKVVAAGSKTGLNEIETLLRNLQEKGGEFLRLKDNINMERQDLTKIKSDYDLILSDVNKELTYANIVTIPEVADKKSYPVRWVIILATVCATFFITILAFAFIDYKQRSVNKID